MRYCVWRHETARQIGRRHGREAEALFGRRARQTWLGHQGTRSRKQRPIGLWTRGLGRLPPGAVPPPTSGLAWVGHRQVVPAWQIRLPHQRAQATRRVRQRSCRTRPRSTASSVSSVPDRGVGHRVLSAASTSAVPSLH